MGKPPLGALEDALGDLPAFDVPEGGREAERVGRRLVREVRAGDPVLSAGPLVRPARIKTSIYADPRLVRQLKARAALEGRPLYDLLEEAIRRFLAQGEG